MRLAQSTAATRPISESPAIRVVVLHVMADRAVMDDVIQLDDAGVGGAQPALLLVRRHVLRRSASRRSRAPAGDRTAPAIDRTDSRETVRRRGSEAESARSGSETSGQVTRSCAVRRAPGTRPRSADRSRDSRPRRMRVGEPRLDLRRSRRARPTRARSIELRERFVQRAGGVAPRAPPRSVRSDGRGSGADRSNSAPTASRSGGAAATSWVSQLAVLVDGRRRPLAAATNDGRSSSDSSASHLAHAVAQQPRGAVAFVQTLRAPLVGNAVADRSSSAREKCRHRLETRRERAGALRRPARTDA